MSRSCSYTILAVGAVALCFACSDELPPLPDSGGVEDGATQDVASPDLEPRPDMGPRPDGEPLPDLGPGACYDNSGCDDASYCKFVQGCSGPGSCVERPSDGCPEYWSPQCGCDGTTYGNPCEAASAGVNIRHPGECGSATACVGNVECKSNEFCNLDYDCAMRHQPGSCEVAPTTCTYLHAPVCGCDNMDYNNACEAHLIGVSVLHDGECNSVDPALCANLDTSYREAVEAAKLCSDDGGTTYACDLEVQNAMMCGCPTYITQFNPSAVQELDALWIEWGVSGCGTIGHTCPPYACAQPTGARCEMNADDIGTCTDY